MEQRNWDAFRHREGRETKNGLVCRQDYLQPALFVWIHFTFTDEAALLGSYRQVLDLVGHSFCYQNTGKGPARMRERQKGLEAFPRLLQDPKKATIRHRLDSQGGPGEGPKASKPGVTGGVGEASFEVWMRKYTPKQYQHSLANILLHGQDWGFAGSTDVSEMMIRIPTGSFAKPEEFLQWVLALPLLHSPALYSATAGYQLEQFHGYPSAEAAAKRTHILAQHPGFELGYLGKAMGHFYAEQQGVQLPMLARVNWLNALVSDIFLFQQGGYEGLQQAVAQRPGLALHPLGYGVLVQAGPRPGIGEGGKAPAAYYEAARLLEPFLLRTFNGVKLAYPEWGLHFHSSKAKSYVGVNWLANMGTKPTPPPVMPTEGL